jgi:threonine/homoserine/homoserine lactone efflux protein
MTLENYLLFVGASLALILIPGPDMLYMLGRCVAQGRRAGLMAALGINAGAYVHLIAAVTGLSAILLTSSIAFTTVKWSGAAYLVYLGINVLLDRGRGLEASTERLNGWSLKAIFLQGFLSDALNPKVAVFFLAFLPQFVDVQAGHAVAQLLELGLTVNMLAILVNCLIVAISAHVSQRLRKNARVARWLHKGMGLMFVGLGARLVTEKV